MLIRWRRFRFEADLTYTMPTPLQAHYLAHPPVSREAFDAVLLPTNHDAFDYASIQNRSRLLVDTRGRHRDTAPDLVMA